MICKCFFNVEIELKSDLKFFHSSGSVKIWDTRQPDDPVVDISPDEGQTKRDCWAVAFGQQDHCWLTPVYFDVMELCIVECFDLIFIILSETIFPVAYTYFTLLIVYFYRHTS